MWLGLFILAAMTLALLFVVWLCIARYTNIFIASLITFLLLAYTSYWAIRWVNEPEVSKSIYRHF